MSRDLNRIVQIPAPTDGSLKRLLIALFKDNIVDRISIKVGILPALIIDGKSDEEGETGRNIEDINIEIDRYFSGLSDTTISVQNIQFYGLSGLYCTFARVRTEAVEILANGRTTIKHEAVPDYRVGEFYVDNDTFPEVALFNNACSKFIRPATGDDSGTTGPDGLNAVLSRMTAVTAGMMEDLAKSQIAQESRMTSLIESQTREFEAQKSKLEETYQKHIEDLDIRRKELDTRESEMDNASTRSTRRKLRGAITNAIKENQKAEIIPESARKVRTPILWIANVGILAPLFFSGWAFWQVSDIPGTMSGNALNWYITSLILRGSLGIFASVAIALYLLKYLRNIEADAGRRALALEQNLFDIDRASWVIETVMELKEEEGMTSVPGPWLEGVTRGLFKHHNEEETEKGPVDALVGLMGSGMALKVKSGDSEVSFDAKASKSAANMQKRAEKDT